MGTSLADNAASVLAFLQKDHELKIRFLADHYQRMWTRFNFFMVATTAITISLMQGLRDGKTLRQAIAYPIAGAVLALSWYVFGAQDRYLVVAYREEIDRTRADIARMLETTLPKFEDATTANVSDTYYQWRAEGVSTTKLVAIFPLALLVAWIAMMAIGVS